MTSTPPEEAAKAPNAAISSEVTPRMVHPGQGRPGWGCPEASELPRAIRPSTRPPVLAATQATASAIRPAAMVVSTAITHLFVADRLNRDCARACL